MQGQGFVVRPPPTTVKPAPIQGMQRQQHAHDFTFVPSQQVQSFSFQNQNPCVGAFTWKTVKREEDKVSGLNQHPASRSTNLLGPHATMSSVVSETHLTLEQLSSFGMSLLLQPIEAQGRPKEETETPVEDDDVPSEFDAAWLKVRHEQVIKSLYSDITRQCATCGRSFKTQEEHSKQMDWHVLKNRQVKKTKKVERSQQWYFTQSLWLKTAEILAETQNGVPVPEFFMQVKKDEDFSVQADEDQKLCALCREAFEDFYCDETEDWRYKGAVYMNAAKGSMASSGKDRSKLGPLVHVKCLPDY